MLQNKWTRTIIQNTNEITDLLRSDAADTVIAYDTETTGLNLRHDHPFLITFALKINQERHAFAFDITTHTKEETNQLIQTLYDQTQTGLLVGQNLSYDLHMLSNVYKTVPHENLMDTMVMIRLSSDAIQEKYGGAPLGLKDFAARYIDADAKVYEKIMRSERSKIAQGYNKQLLSLVADKKEFKRILEVFPNDIEDLPQDQQLIYKNWLASLPPRLARNMKSNFVDLEDVPYDLIDRNKVIEYGMYDAIYTYEIYEMTKPIIEIREQTEIMEMERQLIMPIFDMTGVGFKLNKPYIIQTKARLKAYIRERQAFLTAQAGAHITANQNAVILGLIQDKFLHPEIGDTQEATMEDLIFRMEAMESDDPIVPFLKVIRELRTLSKWYTTYLMRMVNEMKDFDYVYTGLNSAGTVTGRFTSDFQQFPKDAITDYEGKELFDPRQMILAEDGTYLFYLDYSQIELRITGMYTIKLGEPDLNLCRAYMPYKCIHYRTGVPYDYTNPDHLRHWDRRQPNSNSSVWLLEESQIPWTPTDLHAKTTSQAFPDVDPNSAEFKHLRSSVGKRANFACNYGAKARRIHEMFPRQTWEAAVRIYEAYKSTFPGVVNYQQYCYELFRQQNWGANLFGRRYYNTNGHNGSNALIQGSGADLLKEKIIAVHRFLKPYKTKLQMNIHDEISYVMPKDEVYLIPKLKEIMEDLPGTLIPIVAVAEISETTWADKKGFNLYGDHIEYHIK